ncbi:glycosyltransferase family 2 protein [Parvularcula marina]|uniref:glycosyltransferase family 2 protein n=1 Tax=Parvularcula marina TaxID=2292771 RepID=UPI003518DE13
MELVLKSDAVANVDALARRIVVAVPTLNESSTIAACLTSLMKGNENMQFLVLDGGSDDGTREIVALLAAKHQNLSLHHNSRRNQAAAINQASQIADGKRDILIRCDAHAVYPEGYALSLGQKLIEMGADSVVVPMDAVHTEDAGCFERANAMIVDTPLGSGGSAHRGGRKSGFVDHGHHAAFWRTRFVKLGGYDEAMLANQDAEYDTRLRADGGKIWLDAGIRLDYFVRKTPRSLWTQYWRYGRGRADHIRKHLVTPRIRQLIPVLHVLAMMYSGAILTMTKWATAYPIVYGTTIIGAGIWAALKNRTRCGLMAPLVLAIMHTGWGLGFIREMIVPMRRR